MKRALVIAAAIWAAALPSAAQDVWGWSVIIPSVTGADQLGTVLRNQQSSSRAPAAAPARTPAALRFTPSPERRAANIKRFLDQRRGGDPTSYRQLEAVLKDPTLFPRLQAELARFGLRADDMADAYTVWWINTWQAAHGETGDPDRAAVQAVRAQAERAFLAAPGLPLDDDAAKQAFSEGLLVQAVILASVTEQVKNDPAQLQAIGRMARQSARAFGLDLDAVRLTNAGFVPNGG